ncbi:unnamed protein product [Musa acuminata subsp. burmannicoides]
MENTEDGLPTDQEFHHDLVSSLPLEEGMSPVRLRKYQGVWMSEYFLVGTMNAQRYFKSRPTDILLASYPKSGTTWLKALAFATMTRTRHSFGCHPLHHLNPHECVPLLDEIAGSLESLSEIDAASDPRLISTHLPFSLLPESIKSCGCRLIYVCREPKDTLVSRWHYHGKIVTNMGKSEVIPFEKMFDMFCDDIMPSGSIWEHVLGYWNEKTQTPGRVLFLKYEEMLEDPTGTLTRLAEFMGCPFTEEELRVGVPAEIVSLCSFGNLRDLAVQQNRRISPGGIMTTESYYRKGAAGDWRNHLSPEMAEKLDQITAKKLQGTAEGGRQLQLRSCMDFGLPYAKTKDSDDLTQLATERGGTGRTQGQRKA